MKKLYLLIVLIFTTDAFASPQIYPNLVTYRGEGLLSTKVTLYGVEQPRQVELVLLRSLTQEVSKDISLGLYNLQPNRSIDVPIRLTIKTPKDFWICVKSYDNGFPVRTCTTFKQKSIL